MYYIKIPRYHQLSIYVVLIIVGIVSTYNQVYVKINEDKEKEKAASSTAIDDEARAYFVKMEEGDEAALSLVSSELSRVINVL